MKRAFTTWILSVELTLILAVASLTGRPCAAQILGGRPAPTQRDFHYGPHERQALDFWQAKSDTPTPLVVFIHGGGFRAGSKNGIQAATLKELLQAGISVAAFNYRYVTQAPLPAAHQDCTRALQTLRSKAAEWNIDPRRVGAFGGSAGAQLSMYLAFHDDMAKPDSADPVERQSTRLAAVATNGGQTTMDLEWWTKNVPGYEMPHRNFYEAFNVKERAAFVEKVRDISALSLISKDDPPIYMTYRMAPDAPVPAGQGAQGWKVHHVAFGVALKKEMDALGIEADLVYPGTNNRYRNIPHFFKEKLLKQEVEKTATNAGE